MPSGRGAGGDVARIAGMHRRQAQELRAARAERAASSRPSPHGAAPTRRNARDGRAGARQGARQAAAEEPARGRARLAAFSPGRERRTPPRLGRGVGLQRLPERQLRAGLAAEAPARPCPARSRGAPRGSPVRLVRCARVRVCRGLSRGARGRGRVVGAGPGQERWRRSPGGRRGRPRTYPGTASEAREGECAAPCAGGRWRRWRRWRGPLGTAGEEPGPA